jgi:hypothetical protein
MQGFSGLFDVPNARVTTDGIADLEYTNERDPRYQARPTDTVAFSLGMLPFIEIGGRFTEISGLRDLSGNFKLQLPIPRFSAWIPLVALGAQDVGSSVPYFRTKYVVGTEVVGPLELTLGYGNGPDRMKGVFGGGELRVANWASLLGEYDTDEWHAGLRLSVPATLAGVPFRFNGTFRSRLDKAPGRIDFALGLTVPMGLGVPSRTADALTLRQAQGERGAAPSAPVPGVKIEEPPVAPEAVVGRVTRALVSVGYENVRVGFTNDLRTLYIELEDTRFRRNELDGFAIALGFAARLAPAGTPNITLLVHRTGMPMYEVHATVEGVRALIDPDVPPTRAVAEQFSVTTQVTDPKTIRFPTDPFRPSFLRTQLVLVPGLTTFIGTEAGAFDALLSLRPEATLTLWPGAALDAQADLPLAWTSNLDDGQAFASFRHSARLDHALLYQEFALAPGLYALVGAGAWSQSGGALGQLAWVSASGMHRLELLGGITATRGSVELGNYVAGVNSGLATYRFQWAPLGLNATVTAGTFAAGDNGVQVSFGRDFGDTRVEIAYTHSSFQTVALQLSLPLTPRQEMRQGYLQVRGPARFHFRQATTVGEQGHNPLHFGIGQLPITTYNLDDVYLNGDRFGTDYLRANLDRLREAWLESDTVGVSRGLIDPGNFL